MNEIVSFNKEIEFNTNIDKIVSISLEHTIGPDYNNNIKGDLIVSGTYRQTPISLNDDSFSYKIPIDIVLDDKYDLTNMIIDIDDFTYEVVDNNKLKVNIDLLLDKLELKKKEIEDDELIDINDLFLEKEEDTKKELEIPDKEELDTLENDIENVVSNDDSLFSKIDSNNETYKTYSIYIMRENDSIDEIINKYKVTKLQLEEYNNLNEIKNGTKLIIPNSNE